MVGTFLSVFGLILGYHLMVLYMANQQQRALAREKAQGQLTEGEREFLKAYREVGGDR